MKQTEKLATQLAELVFNTLGWEEEMSVEEVDEVVTSFIDRLYDLNGMDTDRLNIIFNSDK